MIQYKTYRYSYSYQWQATWLTITILLLTVSCSRNTICSPEHSESLIPSRGIARLGYTIQAGAFSVLDNAIRLTHSLQKQGVSAYYFVHESGLYKVRFGNFYTNKEAQKTAESIRGAGLIANYYIVTPECYSASYLRKKITATAERLIGIPYKWGGTSPKEGFDCSGLTMVVYRLNGLDLPRTSWKQFQAGKPVGKSQLQTGDLVFFATKGGNNVSHVGIYKGNNMFIHAPKRGKTITMASLSSGYFRSRYIGARTYL